jgi:hypothetical protein
MKQQNRLNPPNQRFHAIPKNLKNKAHKIQLSNPNLLKKNSVDIGNKYKINETPQVLKEVELTTKIS